MNRMSYPKYKNSGVSWLGNVPEGWEIRPLKYYTNFINGMAFKPEDWSQDGIPIIRIENLNGGGNFNGYEGNVSRRYHVHKGDLLFGWSGNRGTSFGPFRWQKEGRYYLNQHIFRFDGFNCDKSWFYWTLKAVTKTIEDEAHGIIGMVHVTKGKLGAIPIPVMPAKEQTTIANFLDHKTNQLDTLIAKKQALIELLKEKRTALISRTVTRGLPTDVAREFGLEPHTRFKDSGIEWLGEIPCRWEKPPLYARYAVELGKMLNESRITGKNLVPYLRNVDVQWDLINFNGLPEINISESEQERYTIRKGDLLVCEGGEVGRSAIVGEISSLTGYQKALHRLRPKNSNESTRFMYYTLYWVAKTGIFNAGGVSTIAHLTGEQLRKFRFPKPPHAEQTAIATYLDRETAKIDKLIEKIQTAIERLQEYRTALITAAVTGKIDVRDWTPDKVAA